MKSVNEIGENAGKVWRTLRQNGAQTIVDLEASTKLSRESVCGAIGWLAKENKIAINQAGRFIKYALTPTESK
ncbi:MAG: winged helix-turn-helix domain-containing protein [Thermoplasmata archaeon]